MEDIFVSPLFLIYSVQDKVWRILGKTFQTFRDTQMPGGAISVQSKSKRKTPAVALEKHCEWDGKCLSSLCRVLEPGQLAREEGEAGKKCRIASLSQYMAKALLYLQFPAAPAVNLINRKGDLELLPTPPALHPVPQ